MIYRPETERQSHYFNARLADQFDAPLHFDETRAVKPLETTAEWEAGEVPETFPSCGLPLLTPSYRSSRDFVSEFPGQNTCSQNTSSLSAIEDRIAVTDPAYSRSQ